MLLLEWLFAIATVPFWFPIVLLITGLLLLVLGILLLSFLITSLGLIIWILKTLYSIHLKLISTRQIMIKELGTSISWRKILRFTLNKCIKWIRDEKKS